MAKLGKKSVDGLYGIGGWRLHDADTKDAEAQKFLTNYKQKFNVDADENAANAYSYASWFIAGLQAAGRNLTAEALAKALQTQVHQDFTTYGAQSFSANHMAPEMVSIDQIQNGKWVQLVAPMKQ